MQAPAAENPLHQQPPSSSGNSLEYRKALQNKVNILLYSLYIAI